MIRPIQASCYPNVLSRCKNIYVWVNLKHQGCLNTFENLMKAMATFLRKMITHAIFCFQFQEFNIVLKHRHRGLRIKVRNPCSTWWQEKLPTLILVINRYWRIELKMCFGWTQVIHCENHLLLGPVSTICSGTDNTVHMIMNTQ